MTNKKKILSVCMNPTIQKTLVFSGLVMDTVNRSETSQLDASGKGINVSRVLSQLGKDVLHLTQLGGPLRSFFLDLSLADGLAVEWVESNSPIRFSHTLIDLSDKSVTELVEEAEPIGEGTEERLFLAFQRIVGGFSTLVISGSMAPGFSPALIPGMVRAARARGLEVILDIRGSDLVASLPEGPSLVKPNLYEFASTFARDLVSRNSVDSSDDGVKKRIALICRELYEKYGSVIILSRGSQPLWYCRDGSLEEYSFPVVEPFNTTGSGDAFTAGLAAALDDGEDFLKALASGARCGALNAGLLRPGVIK